MEFDSVCGKLELAGDLGGWRAEVFHAEPDEGVQLVTFRLASAAPAVPPAFDLKFAIPADNIQMRWYPLRNSAMFIPPNWNSCIECQLAVDVPLVSLLSVTGASVLTFAVSEAMRPIKVFCGYNEEHCELETRVEFFRVPEAPLDRYEFTLRLDRRPQPYYRAVTAAADWYREFPEYRPCVPPEAAFAPLYSSWYNFHQDVHDRELEDECARAVKLGMKTLIVDDGWQTDDNNRGYAFCGDWEISKNRFPDMRAHVKKIHDLGMKYMVWYSVPFVGMNSKNATRFAGKYLYSNDGLKTHVFDPRFPEVREFLINTYETALKEWDIDGFKLDFIDSFVMPATDPAVAQDYAGRDIKSLPAAVDRLLSDVMARLRALKPDILVEFRQRYIGPAIRKYGNMIRVGDCPGDAIRNRVGSLDLRLTSGATAVHSDMIEFNTAEPAEASAQQLLNILFCVPQVSVRLNTISAAQREMLAFWLGFYTAHRETLLRGDLRPEHPELNYPLVTAESASETVTAVYGAGQVAPVLAGKPHYCVNATGGGELLLDLPQAARAEIWDCRGRALPAAELRPGLQRLAVPAAGLVKIS